MTYEEWQTCCDLDAMLAYACRHCRFPDRKRRLFALACCSGLAPLLPEVHRRALGVTEQFAEGLASRKELKAAWIPAFLDPEMQRGSEAALAAWRAVGPGRTILTQSCLSEISWHAANALTPSRRWAGTKGRSRNPAWRAERARHRALLRDVLALPGTPLSRGYDLPAATVAIARWIYQENRFADLPVLADALEEVGFTDSLLVEHCRSPGEHVRGCWAVDLILGKQ
jgi:hypothetical protein